LGRTFDFDSSSPLLPCQENPVSRKSNIDGQPRGVVPTQSCSRHRCHCRGRPEPTLPVLSVAEAKPKEAKPKEPVLSLSKDAVPNDAIHFPSSCDTLYRIVDRWSFIHKNSHVHDFSSKRL